MFAFAHILHQSYLVTLHAHFSTCNKLVHLLFISLLDLLSYSNHKAIVVLICIQSIQILLVYPGCCFYTQGVPFIEFITLITIPFSIWCVTLKMQWCLGLHLLTCSAMTCLNMSHCDKYATSLTHLSYNLFFDLLFHTFSTCIPILHLEQQQDNSTYALARLFLQTFGEC